MELCLCRAPSSAVSTDCRRKAMAVVGVTSGSVSCAGRKSVGAPRDVILEHSFLGKVGFTDVRLHWRQNFIRSSRGLKTGRKLGQFVERSVSRKASATDVGTPELELEIKLVEAESKDGFEVEEGVSRSAAVVDDSEDSPAKGSKRKRRARLERELLVLGTSPIDILSTRTENWNTELFWTVINILSLNNRVAEVLLVFDWWKRQEHYIPNEVHYARFIRMCGSAHKIEKAQALFDEMVNVGIEPTVGTYTCLLQGYAEAGMFDRAHEILEVMISAGLKPNAVTYTGLLHAYGKHGQFNEMAKVFNDMKTVGTSQPDCAPTNVTYSVVVQCYAKGGLFSRMERAFKEMISKDLRPDALCINALVQAYAEAGLLKEMERAYSLVKLHRVGVKIETVRAVALAYIRKSYFYQLGAFVRHVKRNRLNMGNLLENLLLLSHAANFSMRGLAREYIVLKEGGFEGDITSFNVRALSFSKMKMFWDLRVTVLEMQHQKVLPDLVTYGAIIDAYVDAELVEKLPEAMLEMQNLDSLAEIRTDVLVFEAFGRGEFQLCCEELALEMDEEDRRHLTYANLIGYYLKKVEIKTVTST